LNCSNFFAVCPVAFSPKAPVFDFKEISAFKVTVMNADLEAVKAMEDEAEKIQNQYKKITEIEQITDNNSTKVGEKCRRSVGEVSEKTAQKQHSIIT